jgi:predicted dehydrogenase
MADMARAKGVLAVVGTQAPFAPEIAYLRQLIADGFIGEVLSTTLVGRGGAALGGSTIPDKRPYGYLLDRTNGATMLTIAVGHPLAALRSVFGDIAQVSAVLATRQPAVRAAASGEVLPMTAPDQVLVSGVFASGVPVSIHYRGGASRDAQGLWWEIHGARVAFALWVPPATHRWSSFPCREHMGTKKHSSRWKSPRDTVAAGPRTQSQAMSPASMLRWPRICGRAQAQRPALKLEWLCIV